MHKDAYCISSNKIDAKTGCHTFPEEHKSGLTKHVIFLTAIAEKKRIKLDEYQIFHILKITLTKSLIPE